ncbi:hypothetical protein [Francisella sp. SYW-9]|uniref:hypothetical protein n=1 Tax=Francisella sp. SYW-9 TaxID=2610888 RepID=UPI001CD11844
MLSLIGNTPIIKLKKLDTKHNIFAKYILENLIKTKQIKPNQVIVEASSDNMGTSLVAIIAKFYNQ